MPLGKNQINLLPTQSLLPRQTALMRRKITTISVIVLGVYLAISVVIFGYLGVLVVRKSLLSQSIDKEIAKLATFKEIEASQQVIKNELSYLETSLQTQPSASLALKHLEEVFPLPLALTNLQIGPNGSVEADITASDSSALISPEDILETSTAKDLFSALDVRITQNSSNKVVFSLTGQFLPTSVQMSR